MAKLEQLALMGGEVQAGARGGWGGPAGRLDSKAYNRTKIVERHRLVFFPKRGNCWTWAVEWVVPVGEVLTDAVADACALGALPDWLDSHYTKAAGARAGERAGDRRFRIMGV